MGFGESYKRWLSYAKINVTIEDEKGSRSLNRSEASELISKLKNGNNDA